MLQIFGIYYKTSKKRLSYIIYNKVRERHYTKKEAKHHPKNDCFAPL